MEKYLYGSTTKKPKRLSIRSARLGVGLILIKANILMQEMRELTIKQDKAVPVHDLSTINEKKYLNKLINLMQLCTPRILYTKNEIHIEVHGFTDVSLAAYR